MKKELSKDKLDSILLELSNTSIANEKEMDRRNSINTFHKSRTEQKGFRFQNVKLIKIDGEGHELEILHGAVETLKRTMYITIDHGPEKGINNFFEIFFY